MNWGLLILPQAKGTEAPRHSHSLANLYYRKNEKNIILLLCLGIKYKVFIRISS